MLDQILTYGMDQMYAWNFYPWKLLEAAAAERNIKNILHNELLPLFINNKKSFKYPTLKYLPVPY